MKKAYKTPQFRKSSIKSLNEPVEGETVETKLERLIKNGEPTADPNIPLQYSERKDGVNPAWNIKTDKWEVALEAKEAIEKSYEAREQKEESEDSKTKEESGDPSQ